MTKIRCVVIAKRSHFFFHFVVNKFKVVFEYSSDGRVTNCEACLGHFKTTLQPHFYQFHLQPSQAKPANASVRCVFIVFYDCFQLNQFDPFVVINYYFYSFFLIYFFSWPFTVLFASRHRLTLNYIGIAATFARRLTLSALALVIVFSTAIVLTRFVEIARFVDPLFTLGWLFWWFILFRASF